MFIRWSGLMVLAVFVVAACAPVTSQTEDHRQAEVHYKIAAAHLQSDNPTAALKELLQAVRKHPKNSSIHVALAQTYQQKKAYTLAEKHYLEGLRLTPGDPRYQNNLGALYIDMKQWDKAALYFDKAAGNLLFENAHIAVSGKAFVAYKQGDYEQALQLYDDALALAPRFSPAYYHRSQVYRDMNNKRMEIVSLRRAIDLSPQFLRARYRLAELYIADHQSKEATSQLKTIIEFAPDSDWGIKAAELMKDVSDL